MAESADEAVDTLFKGEEQPEIKTEETQEQSTDSPKGETEEVVNTETETEPPAEKEPTLVPIAALHDTRRKAQLLKEENERLKSLVPKTDEAPDPYEDIEAYDAYNRSKWQQEQQMAQETETRERLDISRNQMLQSHQDYSDMERIFEIMTVSDPALIGRMLSSENSAKFAYDTAKSYRNSLMAQPSAEIVKEPSESELRNKSAIDAPNLATATSQASNTPIVEKEEGLMDIFEDQDW